MFLHDIKKDWEVNRSSKWRQLLNLSRYRLFVLHPSEYLLFLKLLAFDFCLEWTNYEKVIDGIKTRIGERKKCLSDGNEDAKSTRAISQSETFTIQISTENRRAGTIHHPGDNVKRASAHTGIASFIWILQWTYWFMKCDLATK